MESRTSLKNSVKVTNAYNKMGYTALNVGNFDLSAHKQKLEGKVDQSAFISLNLLNSQQDFLFTPYKIVKAGKYSIAIIGLTGKTPSSSPYSSSPWREALNKHLPKIQKQSDFIVLLSALTTAENRSIAQDFPAIKVIINSDPQIKNLSPSMINRTLLTQTEPLGQYLGVLDIQLDGTRDWKKNYYHLNNLKVQKQVLTRQIKNEKHTESLKAYKKELDNIPTQIETLTNGLAQQKGLGFSITFEPVTALVGEDPSITALIK